MSGIQGIGPIYGGMSGAPAQAMPPAGAAGQSAKGQQVAGSAAGASSILSLSSTSINATSETLLTAQTPMLATNEAIGAVLLMLILEYLQTSDAQEKQNLTSMIVALASMQQQQSDGQLLFYSSSSLSEESTQLTIATSQGLGAYAGTAASLQQAPPSDAGAPGLNVLA